VDGGESRVETNQKGKGDGTGSESAKRVNSIQATTVRHAGMHDAVSGASAGIMPGISAPPAGGGASPSGDGDACRRH
jgi:hypothetical protein